MPSVLLADPDADTRDLYRLALEMAGLTVLQSESIADALSLVREQWPSLVITAWRLQDGDAPRLSRELRNTGNGPVPVVAITERPRADVRERAAEAGCEAVLSTPVLPDHLVDVAWHLIAHDRRHPDDRPRWAPSPRGWAPIHWRPRRRLRDQHA